MFSKTSTKVAALFATILMAFSLAACSGNSQNVDLEVDTAAKSEEQLSQAAQLANDVMVMATEGKYTEICANVANIEDGVIKPLNEAENDACIKDIENLANSWSPEDKKSIKEFFSTTTLDAEDAGNGTISIGFGGTSAFTMYYDQNGKLWINNLVESLGN